MRRAHGRQATDGGARDVVRRLLQMSRTGRSDERLIAMALAFAGVILAFGLGARDRGRQPADGAAFPGLTPGGHTGAFAPAG